MKARRSHKQNAALHVYLKQLSDALNDAGLDMRKVLKPGVDIPWNPSSAKEHLWRPIQKAITGIDSSADTSKKECQDIYEVLNRHTSQKLGISIMWPNNSGDNG